MHDATTAVSTWADDPWAILFSTCDLKVHDVAVSVDADLRRPAHKRFTLRFDPKDLGPGGQGTLVIAPDPETPEDVRAAVSLGIWEAGALASSTAVSSGELIELTVVVEPGRLPLGRLAHALEAAWVLKLLRSRPDPLARRLALSITCTTSRLARPSAALHFDAEIDHRLLAGRRRENDVVELGYIEIREPEATILYRGPPQEMNVEISDPVLIGRSHADKPVGLKPEHIKLSLVPVDGGEPQAAERVWKHRPAYSPFTFGVPFGRAADGGSASRIARLYFGVEFRELTDALRQFHRGARGKWVQLTFGLRIEYDPKHDLEPLPTEPVAIVVKGDVLDSLAVAVPGGETLAFAVTEDLQRGTAPTRRYRRWSQSGRGVHGRQDDVPRAFNLTVSYDGPCPAAELEATCALVSADVAGDPPSETIQPKGSRDRERTTWVVPVKLRELVDRGDEAAGPAGAFDGGEIVVQLRLERPSLGVAPAVFEITIPLEIERGPPPLLACIDLGTSATAVWLESRVASGNSGLQLPLGRWFRQTPSQPAATTESAHRSSGIDGEDPLLITSDIGLSSAVSRRGAHDLPSLGSLDRAGVDRASVGKRLADRGLRYDISIPFPQPQRMHEAIDQIVFGPKQRLISRLEELPPARVLARRAGSAEVGESERIDLKDLLADCFDELGAYVVPRCLALEPGDAEEKSKLKALFDVWRQGTEVGVVLTHPSGLDRGRLDIYREAGRRFCAAFGQGRAHPRPWVKLVPEALAAARFGIRRATDSPPPAARADRAQTFIALDIGAGTYDVTVLHAYFRDGAADMTGWKVGSHFGVTIGGNNLDRAITGIVVDALRRASKVPEIKADFTFAPERTSPENYPKTLPDIHALPTPADRQSALNLLAAVQRAKARLAEAAAAEADHSGRYEWPSQPMAVEVGRAAEAKVWPVQVQMAGEGGRPARDLWVVDKNRDITLAFGSAQSDNRIELRLGRPAFEARASEQADELENLIMLMGDDLPRMALAEVRRLGWRAPTWIVTGRAALWPPLFDRIRQTIEDEDTQHGDAGWLRPERPFPAPEMKRAVLEGARMLARETHLPLDETAPHPLAIVTFRSPRSGSGGDPNDEVRDIRPIVGARRDGDEITIDVPGAFEVVRCIPGLADDKAVLHERLRRFARAGIPVWKEFEFVSPQDALGDGNPSFVFRWERGDGFVTIRVSDQTKTEIANFTLHDSVVYGDGRDA